MKRIYVLIFVLALTACSPTTIDTPRPPVQEPATDAPASPLPPTSPPATATPPLPTPEIWQPTVGMTWQWQLGDAENINTTFDVDIYDLDAFETEASLVSELHSRGIKVICYISVGSWEIWRPDADDFPSELIGNDYEGWAGENWLDIRQIELLAPVMRARLDMCAEKGFDGIEPDNIDLHWADTGFSISYEDQLAYNIWLAEEAHARGLSIGLKNNEEQVTDLLPYFDWALTESCFADEWCAEMQPFIAANKPVFAAEYTDETSYETFLKDICPQATDFGFSAILKNRDLDEYTASCP